MVSWSVLRSASHYQFTFDACCVGGGKNNYYLLTTQGLGCGPLVTSKAGDQKDPQMRGSASYPWSEMRKDIPLRLTLSYYQQSFEKKKGKMHDLTYGKGRSRRQTASLFPARARTDVSREESNHTPSKPRPADQTFFWALSELKICDHNVDGRAFLDWRFHIPWRRAAFLEGSQGYCGRCTNLCYIPHYETLTKGSR